MITGRQIRAAMAMLGWSLKTLAEESGVPWATAQRMQAGYGIPKQSAERVAAVQKVLEAQGVEFIGEDAVRYSKRTDA